MRITPVRGGGTGSTDPEPESDSEEDTSDDSRESVREIERQAVEQTPEPAPDPDPSPDEEETTDGPEPQTSRDQLRGHIGDAADRVTTTATSAAGAVSDPLRDATDTVTAATDTASGAVDRATDTVEDDEERFDSSRPQSETVREQLGQFETTDRDRSEGPRSPTVAGMTGGSQAEQLEARVAQETGFSRDDVLIERDGRQLRAEIDDDAVEDRLRRRVAEDEGVDPDRVEIERDGGELQAEVQREAGLSGVEAIIRGEQTDRDFLIAEDQRFVSLSEQLGAGIEEQGDGRAGELAGVGVQTGGEFLSPAGTVLFADQAGRELDQRRARFDRTGATALLSIDREDVDTAEEFGTDLLDTASDDPGRAAAAGTGAAVATLAPIGVPRVGRTARGDTTRGDDVLEFRSDLPERRVDPFEGIDPAASRSDLESLTRGDASQGGRLSDFRSDVRSFLGDEGAQLQIGQQRQRQRQRERDPDMRPDPDPTQPSRDPSREIFEGGPRDRASQELQDTMLEQRQQMSPDVGDVSPQPTFGQRVREPTLDARGRGDTRRSPDSRTRQTDAARELELQIDRPFSRPDARAAPVADTRAREDTRSAEDVLSLQAPRSDQRQDTDSRFRMPDFRFPDFRQSGARGRAADGRQTRQGRGPRARRRGRRRTPRIETDDEGLFGEEEEFGFDFDDAAFETGIADADDLFGNGR